MGLSEIFIILMVYKTHKLNDHARSYGAVKHYLIATRSRSGILLISQERFVDQL